MPVISKTNPVNWGHPLNYKRLFWWKCLPGDNISTARNLLQNKYGNYFTSTSIRNGPGGPGSWGSWSLISTNSERMLNSVGSMGIGAANTSYSVAMWIYNKQNKNSGVYVGGAGSWSLMFTAGTRAQITMYNGSINPRADTSAGALSINQWYRVVGVRNCENSTMSLYVNGKDLTSTSTNSGFSTDFSLANRIEVGGSGSGNIDYLNGYIDDISVWNGRALNQSDVWADYTLSRLGYPGVLNRVSSKVYFFLQSSGNWHYYQQQYALMGAA